MLIRKAHVVTPGQDLGVVTVEVRDGKIAALGDACAPASDEETLDADGLLLLPGFVDIHSHGRGGADFCDATDDAFETIGRGKLADGVTSFLATGLTRPEEDLAALCRCAARYRAERNGADGFATCLGVHLEGPFFSPKMAGAQNPAYLRDPDIALIDRLNAVAPVLKVSYAPELPGGIAFTAELKGRGIVASLGHTEADYETFEKARAAGATHLTHFCNAMPPVHHRRPSILTGGLLEDDVLAEVITDGVHLADPMIRLVAKAKGPDGVMVITDAMCAAGEPDGLYSLGGLPVRVENGRATLADAQGGAKADASTVAGSVALYPTCARRYARASGLPLEEAVKAFGFNQLRSLGISDRGEIRVGQVADLVLADEDFSPRATIIGGRVAWRRP